MAFISLGLPLPIESSMPNNHKKTTALNIPYIDPSNPVYGTHPLCPWGCGFTRCRNISSRWTDAFAPVERGVQIEKSTTFTVSHSHSVIRIDKLDTRVFSYEDPSPLDPVASLVAFDPDLQAKITAGLDPTSGKAAPLDSWVRRFLHLPGNWPA